VLLFSAELCPSLAQAQRFKILYKFGEVLNDGTRPSGGLHRDSAGNLYGTTFSGGMFNGGVVFKLDPAGNESILHTFTGGDDGGIPLGGLVADAAGNLYGVTLTGGTGRACPDIGCGVVFKLDSTGNETVLYNFSGGVDGSLPGAGLIRDSAGNLYGTTQQGGDLSAADCLPVGCGVVFKLDTSGNETVLHSFAGGMDGISPTAALTFGTAGTLYGTTVAGGGGNCGGGGTFPGCGTAFKVDQRGDETVLYQFAGTTDGAGPSGLTRDNSGILYGMAFLGGDLTCSIASSSGCGVVFELDSAGNETTLYSFTGGADGAFPQSGVLRDSSGNLYGTTSLGGNLTARQCSGIGCGVIFKLNPIGSETVLHSFSGSDGSGPMCVIRDSSGNLYGTTLSGGFMNNGVVFAASSR